MEVVINEWDELWLSGILCCWSHHNGSNRTQESQACGLSDEMDIWAVEPFDHDDNS